PAATRRMISSTALIEFRRKGPGKTFVSPSTATAAPAAPLRRGRSVMVNVEAARLHRFGQRRARLLIDVRTQFALHDRIEERKNFAFGAADLKFDAAVW